MHGVLPILLIGLLSLGAVDPFGEGFTFPEDIARSRNIAWGPPFAGVRVGLDAARLEFARDEPIVLVATLQNVSGQAVKYSEMHSDWVIELVDEEGKPACLPRDDMYCPPELRPPRVRARDGGTRGFGLDVAPFSSIVRLDWVIDPPTQGVYTVTARRDCAIDGQWGQIRSGPLTITVSKGLATVSELEQLMAIYFSRDARGAAAREWRRQVVASVQTAATTARSDRSGDVRASARQELVALRDDIEKLIAELDRPAEEPEEGEPAEAKEVEAEPAKQAQPEQPLPADQPAAG